MTQEKKQLLLKDLCARLPYGVVLDTGTKLRGIDILTEIVSGIGTDKKIENRKYFLRPMSSITEEEIDELNSISREFGFEWLDAKTTEERYTASAKMQSRSIDFYNAHHFDYRGLIEKGLALEAPEDMYKTK